MVLGTLLVGGESPRDRPSLVGCQQYMSFLGQVQRGVGTSISQADQRDLKELAELSLTFLAGIDVMRRAMQRASDAAMTEGTGQTQAQGAHDPKQAILTFESDQPAGDRKQSVRVL